ncbi:unnamed protein product [Leuciscus chuanchicus]
MSGCGNRKTPSTATHRLKQDYLRIRKDPVPYICAEPLPSNILEWHFVVRGPEKSPYEGGYYHGKLLFPQEFPFKPPSIYMITPNGRFMCNTRLCLSISDFHPDTWNPSWSVSAILIGLLSFMMEKIPTLGSIETSDFTKRQLSAQSLAYNLKDRVFCELFPEVAEEIKMKQRTQRDLSVRQQPLYIPDVTSNKDEDLFGTPLHYGHAANQEAVAQQAPAHRQPKRNLEGALINLCVIAGFVVCVYTVRFVLHNIGQD